MVNSEGADKQRWGLTYVDGSGLGDIELEMTWEREREREGDLYKLGNGEMKRARRRREGT